MALLKPGNIFKTTSGKIQRRKTKQAFLQNGLNELSRWTLSSDDWENDVVLEETDDIIIMREQRKAWFAAELKIDVNGVDNQAEFTALGLDSIRAIEASEYLSEKFNKNVKASCFWDYLTVLKCC